MKASNSGDDRQRFISLFSASLYADGLLAPAFSGLSLSRPVTGSDLAADLKRIDLRLIQLRGQDTLCWTFRYERRDETRNFPVPEGINLVAAALDGQFLCADLHCCGVDHSLRIDRQGQAHLISKRQAAPIPPTDPVDRTHNRAKHRHVDPAAPWLRLLGVTDTAAQVVPRMQDKFRQIDKFVEIFEDLLNDLPQPALAGRPLAIVDMGCGKAYLTFAIFDHVRRHFPTVMAGVEQRPELVKTCNAAAQTAGFAPVDGLGVGLSFHRGTIADWQPATDSPWAQPDILVALHACDTATDDTLAAGIRSQAALIICSPCCHKQVRSAMTATGIITRITRFGILEERLAEILTDSLRALVLEAHGYIVKVFEFISTEHTGKNLMISAVRQPGEIDSAVQTAKLTEARQLMANFGIDHHYLLDILG